ncbi:MAG: PIN domain-containing protein [Catalinimonas sp.]
MLILADTNILYHYIGKKAAVEQLLLNRFEADELSLAVSVVTIGEMLALRRKSNWKPFLVRNFNSLLNKTVKLDINDAKVLSRYAEIDAYSQKRADYRGQMISNARPMKNHQNDIWIAACGSVAGLTLVTTDRDYDHLDGVFLNVERVQASSLKALGILPKSSRR